jgi:hypothetical protein
VPSGLPRELRDSSHGGESRRSPEAAGDASSAYTTKSSQKEGRKMRSLKVLAVVGVVIALIGWLTVPALAAEKHWVKRGGSEKCGKESGLKIVDNTVVRPGSEVAICIKGLRPRETVIVEILEWDWSIFRPDDTVNRFTVTADDRGEALTPFFGAPQQPEDPGEHAEFYPKVAGQEGPYIYTPHKLEEVVKGWVLEGTIDKKPTVKLGQQGVGKVQTWSVDPTIELKLIPISVPTGLSLSLDPSRFSLGPNETKTFALVAKGGRELQGSRVAFKIQAFADGVFADETDPLETTIEAGVPSLTQWGLLALAVLLAGSLAFMIRRRLAPRPAGA